MGLVASIRGRKEPRHYPQGAGGSDQPNPSRRGGLRPETGDGAGILIQIPHVFFARDAASWGCSSGAGRYGVADVFFCR